MKQRKRITIEEARSVIGRANAHKRWKNPAAKKKQSEVVLTAQLTRMALLSPEQRSEQARLAARARWAGAPRCMFVQLIDDQRFAGDSVVGCARLAVKGSDYCHGHMKNVRAPRKSISE